MPTSFENEIRSLMQSLQSPAKVAEDLARRWHSQLLSEAEQIDCAQFLISAGLLPQFFKILQTSLSESGRLPWAQVSEAIGRAKLKPTEEEIEAIIEGARIQKGLSDLVRSHQLDIWSRKFAELRTQSREIRKQELEDKKQELKDRLQFLRANRLENEEKKALEEIEAMFPSAEEFARERESFEMRRARDVIARANRPDPMIELERKALRLPEDQVASKSLIVSRATELAKADPKQAYNLALGLHFMDFHFEALQVLDFADRKQSPSIDWLRLDLMLHAHRFIDVIEESKRLEAEHANDPESAFAATYARARALKGLGQTSTAVDLMRSLVNVRPSYKSAQSLLTDWTGGEE
jgi:hypothetical protein